MFAKVIVDISHTNVDKVFDYRVPQGMDVRPGMRVSAPFGNAKVEGVVIDVSKETEFDADKIKDIGRPLEDFCALTEEQIRLAAFMKEQYNTTLAQSLRLMIPAQLRGGRVSAKTQNYIFLEVTGEAYETALASLRKKGGAPKFPAQIEILEQLKEKDGQPAAAFGASSVKTLEKKGYISVRLSEVARRPFQTGVEQIEDYDLTEKQRQVLDAILGESEHKRFLLHGVTGSGKTELYIRVIRDCLSRGKTAVLLVPEISLTPQTYQFLKQRFSEPVAVFHSGLSAGERYDEWLRVRRGEAKIVLGARSAIFAPLENIGAIIIDEAHESSYKSDHYPKYTAQEIAKARCKMNDAILILGSATPDIETYYAAEQGEYHILKMPDRLFGLKLPEVRIVDMRAELRDGNRGVISGELYKQIKTALAQKRQAMLFLNRRGYATFVMCRACGYTLKCEACDVTMTYHKHRDELRCHYCGRTQAVQKICPQCGKPYLKQFGTGTQQVEEQVQRLFPGVRTIRMDMDSMGGKDAHLHAFERFAAGEADILIGTQMITKGFDFKGVSLSAVLAADTLLNIPDYRSAEYTFSQITQIAGRAGRKDEGRVVLQTYNPEHYAVRYAAKHDYDGFYKHEIALRKMAKLPPFSVFVQVLFAGEKEDKVIAAVKDFLTKLKGVILPQKDDIISVRASEALIKRVNNQYRYQVLINLKNAGLASDIHRLVLEQKYKDVLTGIDTNPAVMA